MVDRTGEDVNAVKRSYAWIAAEKVIAVSLVNHNIVSKASKQSRQISTGGGDYSRLQQTSTKRGT